MRLIITRPWEDAQRLAAGLTARGHGCVIAPLMEIVPRGNISVPVSAHQAICISSANAVLGIPPCMDRTIPVFAVGEQSAQAAFSKGFKAYSTPSGNVHGLAQLVASALDKTGGTILYLSGAETSGDLEGQLLKAGFEVTRLVVYDATALPLSLRADEISGCRGVILYSSRSAILWRQEIIRLDFEPIAKKMMHFCLSPQVANALPEDWPRLIAEKPTEGSMLALIDLEAKSE